MRILIFEVNKVVSRFLYKDNKIKRNNEQLMLILGFETLKHLLSL
jgi:hypothetical protein